MLQGVLKSIKDTYTGDKQAAHNSALADKQNAWNLDMWNRQNAYNTPAAQMMRLKQAGLNPNLIYEGATGVQAASAPAPAANESTTNFGSLLPNLGQVNQTFQMAKQIGAQTDKLKAETAAIEAQTGKTTIESDILKSDASFRDALNESVLKLNNMNIGLGDSKISLNDVEIKKLRSQIMNLDQSTSNLVLERDKISSAIANMDADTFSKKLTSYLNSKEFKYKVNALSAAANLNNVKSKEILETYLHSISRIDAETKRTLQITDNLTIDNEQLYLNLTSDRKYKNVERVVGVTSKVTLIIGDVIKSFGAAVSAAMSF